MMNSPFRVLGIALVVEGMGTGTKLAFRYPVSATAALKDNPQQAGEADLFFSLPPRVMAKLFRPKKPLCGQPMTVSVGGIVFCCRAVLLQDSDNAENNSSTSNLVLFSVIVALVPLTVTSAIPISGWFDGGEAVPLQDNASNHQVGGHGQEQEDGGSGRLASVSFRSIRRVHVSLGRLCRVLEREERRCNYVSIQSSIMIKLRNDLGLTDQGTLVATTNSAAATKNPTSTAGTSGSSVVSTATGTAPSDASTKMRHRRLGSKSSIVVVPTPSDHPSSGGATGDQHQAVSETHHDNVALLQYQEREQEALEIMLASLPDDRNYENSETTEDGQHDQVTQQPLHGNLARELAQTFHALSRHDHLYAPSTMGLLSGKDGIVYMNRHVAVPIESISGDSTTFSSSVHTTSGGVDTLSSPTAALMDQKPIIRPYHTLLFPHASPSECLETLSTSSSLYSKGAPQQKLEQLLLMANPRKPLSDISMDAALPLPLTLELAGYLVSHGVCVVSPIVGRSSRFACRHDAIPKKLQSLSLDFCQRFGPHLSIFLIVSVLTSHNLTLGELMSRVSSSVDENEDETIALVGDRIAASLGQQQQVTSNIRSPSGLVVMDKGAAGGRDLVGGVVGPAHHHASDPVVVRTHDVEEVVYSMAVWLRSHLVIVEVKDYLVAVNTKPVVDPSNAKGITPASDNTDSGDNSAKKEDAAAPMSESVKSTNSFMERERINAWGNNPEEALYNELIEADCLNGNISTVALCWKFGVDGRRLQRFRTWGFRNTMIRVITRAHTAGDDWGAT